MIVGFTTTYVISDYHHWCCEFESRSGRRVQHYVIKFVSDLRQVGGFLRVLRFPPPIKLTATIYRNIVESGVKHHKANNKRLPRLRALLLQSCDNIWLLFSDVNPYVCHWTFVEFVYIAALSPKSISYDRIDVYIAALSPKSISYDRIDLLFFKLKRIYTKIKVIMAIDFTIIWLQKSGSTI